LKLRSLPEKAENEIRALISHQKIEAIMIEIKLTEAQKETIKIMINSGHSEKGLMNHFINIGILFQTTSPANKIRIMKILEPK